MWSPLLESASCRWRAAAIGSVTSSSMSSWSSSSGGRRPNTVRAYAHDLKAFFTVVGKDPVEVTPARRVGVRDRAAAAAAGRRERGADLRWRAGLSASTIQRRLAAVSSLYGYLVAAGRRGGGEPGAAWVADAAEPPSRPAGRAVGARRATAAADPRAGRGRRADGGAAHRAGPGDGRGDAAGRAAPLRGARAAARGSASRRVAGVHRRRQGRPSTAGADVADVLRDGRRLPQQRTTRRRGDGPGVRGVEGPAAGQPLSADGLDRSCLRRAEPGRAGARDLPRAAPHLFHPAARRRAWRSKRSRPRPVTARSSRPGSICISATTGSPTSTARRGGDRGPSHGREPPDDRRRCNRRRRQPSRPSRRPDQGVHLG